MGTELDAIQEIIMCDKDSGKEIARLNLGQIPTTEESSNLAYSSTTFAMPPEPNTMFVIAEGPNRTVISIYRPKKFNRFQVWMYKFSFGIKIIQGSEKIREYMSKVFWSPEDRK